MQGGIMLELILNWLDNALFLLAILVIICGAVFVVQKLIDRAKDTVHNCILCFKAVFRPSRAFYTYLILKY